MKGIYFLLAIGLLLTAKNVSAQRGEPGEIRIVEAQAEREGDRLRVDFTLDYSALDVSRNEELIVLPVVITRAQDTIWMPYLLFPGKIRDKVNRRKERLYGEDSEHTLPYRVVYPAAGQTTVTTYTESLPFEDRMYGGRIALLQEIVGCADCRKELSTLSLGNIPNPPRVAFIIPEAVTEEERWTPVYIHFPWDQAVILSGFMGNAAELEKIDRLMSSVTENPNVRLEQIHLKGYASPEGAYSYNTRLAARRADAVGDYIRTQYRPQESLLLIESEPEDWAGLRSRVDSSDLAYRSQVLAVIDHTTDPDARDEQIRRLDAGHTYRYLLENYYPVLRRVDCGIKYTIEEPYTLAEIQEMVKNNPDRLSLNELFLVAGTYPPGSDDFNQVFVIAARLYPEDEVVNANRAAAALQANDLETARQCLGYDNHYAEAWNNLGVLLWREGRIPEAVSCFEDARACGCEEAAYNLKQVVAENRK